MIEHKLLTPNDMYELECLKVRKKWVHVLTAVLVLGSLYAGSLMLNAMPQLDEAVFTPERSTTSA